MHKLHITLINQMVSKIFCDITPSPSRIHFFLPPKVSMPS